METVLKKLIVELEHLSLFVGRKSFTLYHPQLNPTDLSKLCVCYAPKRGIIKQPKNYLLFL